MAEGLARRDKGQMSACRIECCWECTPTLSHRHLIGAICTGEFDDRVFVGLDFVLAEARRRRLRVILTLLNYWGDYGGMPQVGFSPCACRSQAGC